MFALVLLETAAELSPVVPHSVQTMSLQGPGFIFFLYYAKSITDSDNKMFVH